jgi:RHS repeat-associated protein
VTLSYTYDALNQRTSLTDSLGGIWSYGFDEKSRLASITAPWGDTHIMEYDPAGRRTELVNTTGRQTLAGYASDRLSQLEHFQNAIPVARSGFAYSEDGAVSLLRDIDDATQSRSLAYDGINRLLQVAEGVPAADGGVPIPVEDYAYDENGNRTVSHLSNSYVVDDHNRLLQDDTYSYGYDEKGNRVTRTRTSDGRVETFTYNSVNQLIGVSSTDGLEAAYAYDALGRRIAKTLNGEVTSYVYDIGNFYDITGHDRLLDFQNGALATRWLHGQQIDEPVGYESYAADTTAGAGTAYALHADRQGSVIAVTEQSTDTVVARYVYDAFGQREQTVSTVLQDYGFTGREIDPETDLYYYRARHYDPGQGRFIQSDPLGFAAGDLNLYAYTWNDPANWSDPSGLSASGDASRTSAGAAALARQSARRVGRGARCAVNKVSSFLSGIGRELVRGGDLSQLKVQNLKCRVRVKAPKCSCRSGGFAGAAAGAAAGYAAGGGFSSFPAGTEVLTPNGRVAIESLHEGDLVIARDEDNGMSGVFPVTALMSRTVPEVIWLTLENAEGKSTRMGVTSEHPLFTVGEGWVDAGELVAGDVIRDSALQELSVLTVTLDTTPQRVHNLEVAGAHTYFAGDMEAWGHNALNFGKPGRIVALCMHLVFGGRDSDADGKADTYKPSSVRQSQSINTKPPQQNEQTCDPKGGRKRK